jgi:hypothetical protein
MKCSTISTIATAAIAIQTIRVLVTIAIFTSRAVVRVVSRWRDSRGQLDGVTMPKKRQGVPACP